MKATKVQQKGFSAVEAVVIILVVAILCSGGWFVWRAQHKGKQTDNATTQNNNSQKEKTTQKTYTNQEYGFSFNYPSTWALKEDLEDTGNGVLQGTITVTAPSGTTVHFDPTTDSENSACVPQSSDRPDHTADCSTLRILSTEKTTGSSNEKPVYFTKRQLTDPIEHGSNTKYFVALTTVDESLKINTPIIDDSGELHQPITLASGDAARYVNIYITESDGVSGSYGSSTDYFNSKIVTEGTPILTSFRIR